MDALPPGPALPRAAQTAAWIAREAGEWSLWVWVMTMWVTVSPFTASSSAAICAGSPGPGSMIATSPLPTI